MKISNEWQQAGRPVRKEEEDLRFEADKKDEMLVKLSQKLGKTKEELAVFFTAK